MRLSQVRLDYSPMGMGMGMGMVEGAKVVLKAGELKAFKVGVKC